MYCIILNGEIYAQCEYACAVLFTKVSECTCVCASIPVRYCFKKVYVRACV